MDSRRLSWVGLAGTVVTGAFLLSGCGTVQDTVYLQSLSVVGPVNQPPVRVNHPSRNSGVTLTPRFSVANRKSFEGRLAGDRYPYDTTVQTGNDLHWSIPSAQLGLDVDVRVSSPLAVGAGLSYASAHGQEFWGGNMGIGIPFAGDAVSGRFDVGIQFQTMYYDGSSVLVHTWTPWWGGTPETTVTFFHDVERATNWNVYGTLTLNSVSEGFINAFGSLSVSAQTLAGYTPTHPAFIVPFAEYHATDARAENTALFLLFTPGVFVPLTPSTRLLLGVRFIKELSIEDGESTFPIFMGQVDISL